MVDQIIAFLRLIIFMAERGVGAPAAAAGHLIST